jgi:tRNA-dihydrouridine synthase A
LSQLDYRLSIAPMMQYTDRHYRYFMRQFTKRTLLFTEMVVGNTITHNLKSDYLDKVLGFEAVEHPIAIQLGGDDPEVMTQAAKVCKDYGYDEINLNIGCPSDKVQKGRFGVCLMRDAQRVAELVDRMQQVVSIPVTVKHRIGVDDDDSYEFMLQFVDTVAQAGCQLFSVHARKAWLHGLSPSQNRNIPPLKYDYVYRLKQERPDLTIVINGGIRDIDETQAHLEKVDGVMIGRAAYQQPELFANVDKTIFGDENHTPPSMETVLAAMDEYLAKRLAQGDKVNYIAKHLVGLFKNRRNARRWRRSLTENMYGDTTGFSLLKLYQEAFGEEEPVLI